MKTTIKKRYLGALGAVILSLGAIGAPHDAAAQPQTIGETFAVGFNFCPRGTARLDGQVLPIANNTALFSLLGNIYGGDGRTTFALPDLRGRFPTSQGSGPGLSIRQIGQRQGSDQSLLTVNQLASHTHLVGAVNQVGDKGGPVTDFISKASNGSSNYHDGPEDVRMDPTMISTTGVTTPSINTSNPYLVVNWCIVLFGIYPSRN